MTASKCLGCHVEHRQTRPDDNLVENAARPTKLGLENGLFVGHPDAGQRSAILYSVIVSCLRHGVEQSNRSLTRATCSPACHP